MMELSDGGAASGARGGHAAAAAAPGGAGAHGRRLHLCLRRPAPTLHHANLRLCLPRPRLCITPGAPFLGTLAGAAHDFVAFHSSVAPYTGGAFLAICKLAHVLKRDVPFFARDSVGQNLRLCRTESLHWTPRSPTYYCTVLCATMHIVLYDKCSAVSTQILMAPAYGRSPHEGPQGPRYTVLGQ